MPSYGFLPEGFVAKPASVIKTEIETEFKLILGDSAGSEPDGSIPSNTQAGQLVTLMVDREAGFWDLIQEGATALDPNAATGQSLTAVAALTGTIREGEEDSTVVVTCTGTPATLLTAGREVSVPTSGSKFQSLADGTIAAVNAWTALTLYVAGQRVRNDSPSKVYQCITGGTSAGAGGPTGTASDILDGTVHWKYVGLGTGAVDVEFAAEEAGAIAALAGTLTKIETPVSGWSTAVNLSDAAVGRLQESDAQLRVRRQAELAGEGLSTADAIRAAILKVNENSTDPNHLPILSCTVFHNDTDTTNSDGVPPHAVEVLALYAGLASATTDQDIADAVFTSVAAGIATYGTETASVTDSQGVPQTVKWTKPTLVSIYVSPQVFYDPTVWTDANKVKQAAISAILTYAQSYYQVGIDVHARPISGAILFGPSELDTDGNAVAPATDGSPAAPGFVDVNPCYIGTAPGPATESDIILTARQLASFDSSRIVVTATAEAP